MSELTIYVEGSSYESFTYANSTEDETISFATLLNREDNNGYKPIDIINTLLNNGYKYTTDNTYGYYFRFWNGSGEFLFNTVQQNVTLKADTWWDAEIYMGPATNTWIYTSSGWKQVTPYVYTSSGWKQAQAYIYTSSGWKPC